MVKEKRIAFAWIGFTDEAEEGKWVWVTGEPVTFTNWYRGEPNNFGKIEHYAVITSPDGPHGPWADLSSSSKQAFVVEFDNTILKNKCPII